MRKSIVAAAAVAGAYVLLLPGAAHAGSTISAATCAGTLCTWIAAIEDVSCGSVVGGWQCTPKAAASSSPRYGTRPANSNGITSWSGSAICEYRLKADGFTTGWTAWTSCTPPSQSGSGTASWSALEPARGGQTNLVWGQISNYDTWGTQDCIEVRMRVTGSGSVQQNVGGVVTSSPVVTVVHPSPTGWDYGSICE